MAIVSSLSWEWRFFFFNNVNNILFGNLVSSFFCLCSYVDKFNQQREHGQIVEVICRGPKGQKFESFHTYLYVQIQPLCLKLTNKPNSLGTIFYNYVKSLISALKINECLNQLCYG